MKCKIFQSRSYEKLQDEVNAWMEKNKIQLLDIVLTQFSTIKMEDSVEWWLVHTLVLFYSPRSRGLLGGEETL